MSELSIEDILAVSRAMDEADIPKEGRVMQYQGKDGNLYTLSEGCEVDEYMFNQMPDWIQALMLGVIRE